VIVGVAVNVNVVVVEGEKVRVAEAEGWMMAGVGDAAVGRFVWQAARLRQLTQPKNRITWRQAKRCGVHGAFSRLHSIRLSRQKLYHPGLLGIYFTESVLLPS
jgi:hypothetical protein